jgi:hypothetical protein
MLALTPRLLGCEATPPPVVVRVIAALGTVMIAGAGSGTPRISFPTPANYCRPSENRLGWPKIPNYICSRTSRRGVSAIADLS